MGKRRQAKIDSQFGEIYSTAALSAIVEDELQDLWAAASKTPPDEERCATELALIEMHDAILEALDGLEVTTWVVSWTQRRHVQRQMDEVAEKWAGMLAADNGAAFTEHVRATAWPPLRRKALVKAVEIADGKQLWQLQVLAEAARDEHVAKLEELRSASEAAEVARAREAADREERSRAGLAEIGLTLLEPGPGLSDPELNRMMSGG